MSQEERVGAGVIKLAAIIALNGLHGGAEQGLHKGKASVEEASDFSFKGKVHKWCEQSSRMTK